MPRSPFRVALLALGLSSISILAAACAGPQSKDKVTRTKNDDGETMICHQEYPTGSHIGRTVCRTEEQSDREREEARKLVTTPPPAPPPKPESSGRGR